MTSDDGNITGNAVKQAQTPSKPRPNTRGRYVRSGVHTLKKAVQVLGSRTLPTKRTALGRELRDWQASLVRDLGGEDAISTQQRALVDLAVRSKLLVDSVDAYILAMPSPVNKRERKLFDVVRERGSLVNQLQSILRDLGLQRRAAPVPDFHAYVAMKDAERAAAQQGTTEGTG